MKILHGDEIQSFIWKLFTQNENFHAEMKIFHCDSYSSRWWKLFFDKIIHYDENLKIFLTFTIMLEIHHYYELPALWWKFISGMKIHDCNERYFIESQFWWTVLILIQIHHCDEHSSLWWEFIIVMKIHQYDEHCLYQTHHFDEVRST